MPPIEPIAKTSALLWYNSKKLKFQRSFGSDYPTQFLRWIDNRHLVGIQSYYDDDDRGSKFRFILLDTTKGAIFKSKIHKMSAHEYIKPLKN